jgi:AAA-like domain
MAWRRPLSFVYGNCLFGSCGPWALFALEPHGYATLTAERKRERFGALLAAIEAAEADIQLLRVARGWDAARELGEQRRRYAGPHARLHERYLEAQLDGLRDERAEQPAIYLAASLEPPQRDVGAFVAGLAERSPREVAAAVRAALRAGDARRISGAELERLRRRADEVHARVSAYIGARPARTVEVQWLVRRAFCRALGEPDVDGLHEPQALVFERNGAAVLAPLEADVMRWSESHVESRGRTLRVESELGVGWQAHLLAGALPERAPLGSPRLELMFGPFEATPFGIDLTLSARYLPNGLAMRLVRRRVQDADEIARAEAGGDQGISDRGYDRTQDARDLLSHLQSSSHPPLLRATLAVAVSAPSHEQLELRVEAVRRAFGEVRLHRPLGDQLRLFVAALPGQRAGVAGYDDVLTTEQVAAMVPLATHAVGSRRGMHLGHTLSGARHPVRLNLREGSDADRNATILAIGAPGSGKTTLAQKLAYEAFLLGARVIDCDPKGDHRLHELPEVAAHVETIALRGERALRGMLDPLRIAPEHLRRDATVSFLCDLLPARAEAAWEVAVAGAVDVVCRRAAEPTCSEVVHALAAGDAVDRQVGRILAGHAEAGLTQLAFADASIRLPAVGTRQVTYLPIRDLPAPQPGTPRSEYSQLERVGEHIVRLIAMFATGLMASERSRLKVFSFDEGWRLLGDPVGRMLLASLQRMGRSELAVPIISTQLVSDTLVDGRESLENLVGATFVFGLRSEREAERALALLDLDPADRALRDQLLAFDRGRCLMRDHRGRVEAVQVEVLLPRLLAAFSTTPAAAAAA